MRWIHVFTGILWIGLLYYFNFVQIPTMPKIPAELKPAVGKLHRAGGPVLLPLGRRRHRAVRPAHRRRQPLSRRGADLPAGLRHHRHRHVAGADHGRQCLVRDLAEPEEGAGHRRARAPEAKTAAARLAMLASRTNTMLSIPMLYCMVMQKMPADLVLQGLRKRRRKSAAFCL